MTTLRPMLSDLKSEALIAAASNYNKAGFAKRGVPLYTANENRVGDSLAKQGVLHPLHRIAQHVSFHITGSYWEAWPLMLFIVQASR